MSKTLAEWLGWLLLEVVVLAVFGVIPAAVTAVPLLLYAYSEKPRLLGFLRRFNLSPRPLIWIAACLAIAVLAVDGWRSYAQPFLDRIRVELPRLPVAPPTPSPSVPGLPSSEDIARLEREVTNSAVRNQIWLFERDPESWPGHAADRV